ncbi:MAG: family 20 glycosylhydrolase [Bacteroidales bacterium]|nr:family 20 glycosylhydrolase [Bacteroidales bacterium]
MKRSLSILAVFVLIAAGWSCQRETPDVRIIPEPAQMTVEPAMVKFPARKVIYTSSKDSSLLAAASYLGKKLNYTSIENGGTNPGHCIYLEVARLESANPEAYTLKTSGQGVVIRGNSARGVFYGIQTLLQLLPPEVYGDTGLVSNKGIRIPQVNITDEPRYPWRGMHLDVSRHFFPVEFIKKYIDVLAMHKMNTFHWHLTDDQGWRIEIKKYPKLTETGSVRKEADGSTYGGFYTQEQIKEVVAYAASRFIDVMPEIEMPGHAVAALTAYPELSCTGGPFEVRTEWGVSDDVFCAGKEATFAFVEDILKEVVALFPYKYMHIGGDECPKVRWSKCPDCQKLMKTVGLKDEMQLQSYFIRRIEKFLIANNRSLVGWDEILEGGLAPEATVMSWRGVAGGIDAARQGHDVIMSPNSHCYFDHYQGDARFEPKAWGGYLTLEKVYSLEPTPAELNPEEAKHVLGAQANIWTEYITSEKQVEYMALPRMSALAEVGWTPKSLRDYEKFLHRLVRQYQRFDAMQLNYRVPTPVTTAGSYVFTDSLVVDFHNPLENAEILYTTDGSDPQVAGKVYSTPLVLKESVLIKALTRMKSGRTSVLVEIHADKQEFRPGIRLAVTKVPGVDFDLYDGLFKSVLEMDNKKPVSRGVMTSLSLPDPVPAKPFGLIMRGYLKIADPGIYRFYLNSDDGSTLSFGERMVIDHDGLHGATEKSAEIALGKGWHGFELRYFDAGGGKSLVVQWSGKGIEKQQIPAENLASMSTQVMIGK